ncbi:DUF362 domain-containing protein [Candidatus Latescibacterota bacterium]
MERREFLKKSSLAGALYAGTHLAGFAMPMPAHAVGTGGGIDVEEGVFLLDQGKEKNITPEIRPEILDNPRAVFLIKTSVSASPDDRGFFTDARPQIEETGKKVVHQIFIKGSNKGGSSIVRPNFTTVPDDVLSPVCGINTSCDFIAGFIQSLRDLGNTNVITSARGTNVVNHRKTGIYSVFDKYDIKLIEANYLRFSHYRKKDLNWHRVPGKPMVWKNIPTYRPIGDRDNFFINMPKLKCHNLGLTTLAIKNLQGVVTRGYGHYCDRWSMLEILAKKSYNINFKRDFVKNYYENVESAFLKHRAAGFKHWDVENAYPVYESKGGWNTFKKIKNDSEKVKEFMSDIPGALMWDEIWCQRAIDSAMAIKPGINILEGIIGRDGSGFNVGKDELCNIIVIGLSMTEVDAIGSYIMGHDPNELLYTRIAKERGYGECDPAKIKLYWIREGEIVPVKNLSEIKRYRLGVNMHTWGETGKRLFW